MRKIILMFGIVMILLVGCGNKPNYSDVKSNEKVYVYNCSQLREIVDLGLVVSKITYDITRTFEDGSVTTFPVASRYKEYELKQMYTSQCLNLN